MTNRATVFDEDGSLLVCLGHSDSKAILTGTDDDDYDHVADGSAIASLSFFNEKRVAQFTLLVDFDQACTLKLQVSADGDSWYDFYDTVPNGSGGVAYVVKTITLTPDVPGEEKRNAYKIEAYGNYWSAIVSNASGNTLNIKLVVM